MEFPVTQEERDRLVSTGWHIEEYGAWRPGGYQVPSSFNLSKTDDGRIRYSGFYPTNVDVDDASYDTLHFESIYESLGDFLSHKEPISTREWKN